MKTMIYITLIVIVAFALVPASMAKDLKVISRKWSDHAPPTAGGNVFMRQKWVPRVNKELAKIGYKLDITYYHALSLYKYADQVQACEDGLIDIPIFVPSYEIARAPLHGLISIPFMGFNAQSACRIWFELQDTIPELADALFWRVKAFNISLL